MLQVNQELFTAVPQLGRICHCTSPQIGYICHNSVALAVTTAQHTAMRCKSTYSESSVSTTHICHKHAATSDEIISHVSRDISKISKHCHDDFQFIKQQCSMAARDACMSITLYTGRQICKKYSSKLADGCTALKHTPASDALAMISI